MSIKITEIIGRSDQGVTKPFICRADNEEIYFVKGRGAGRRSLLCEFIASSLGIALGLPIPPIAIVDVPESLVALGSRDDLSELGAGPAFASLRKKNISELSLSLAERVPDQMQRDVLAFDWWVRNGDRTLNKNGGNPNLFWDSEAARLVVLDHNQAFDLDFSPQGFRDFHVFRRHCGAIFEDWITRSQYGDGYIKAMSNWAKICDTIPAEWWFVDAEMTVPVAFDLHMLQKQLLDCRSDAFWNLK